MKLCSSFGHLCGIQEIITLESGHFAGMMRNNKVLNFAKTKCYRKKYFSIANLPSSGEDTQCVS